VDDALDQAKMGEVKAREAAGSARNCASLVSMLMALSMLVGASVAAVSAALGGQLRDLHP
jgi:hypothetical protein